MDHARAAEIQIVLEGIALPATRDELIAYAGREDPQAAAALRAIPDGDYDRIDAVGEALLRVQPSVRTDEPLPKPESGLPPGGVDYLNPHPESGHVRTSTPPDNPPQKAIDTAGATVKRQAAKQQREG